MTMKSLPCTLACLFAIGMTQPALAQAPRTFVSASGSDANVCSRTAPCRTFQTAHNKTNAGGEINVLDPAGYGAVTITKAISIVNDGVGSAGVLIPTGQAGITVNANPGDAVNLRGLILEGAAAASTDGIIFNTGKSLTITNCVIRNLTQTGIYFQPNASSSLQVVNTYVANTGYNGIHALQTGSGAVKIALDRVEVYQAQNGVVVNGDLATGTVDVTITESISSFNNNYGYYIQSPPGAALSAMMIVRSVSSSNNRGAGVNNANSTMRIAQSTVTGNQTALDAGVPAGTLLSYGDNYIDGNVCCETPPNGTIPKK